jgi:hypothetical protein
MCRASQVLNHPIPHYPQHALTRLPRVHSARDIFGSANAIGEATKDKLSSGLVSLHAFQEQLRFVKGGLAKLAPTFWAENADDMAKVKMEAAPLCVVLRTRVVRLHKAGGVSPAEWPRRESFAVYRIRREGQLTPSEGSGNKSAVTSRTQSFGSPRMVAAHAQSSCGKFDCWHRIFNQ